MFNKVISVAALLITSNVFAFTFTYKCTDPVTNKFLFATGDEKQVSIKSAYFINAQGVFERKSAPATARRAYFAGWNELDYHVTLDLNIESVSRPLNGFRAQLATEGITSEETPVYTPLLCSVY